MKESKHKKENSGFLQKSEQSDGADILVNRGYQ